MRCLGDIGAWESPTGDICVPSLRGPCYSSKSWGHFLVVCSFAWNKVCVSPCMVLADAIKNLRPHNP